MENLRSYNQQHFQKQFTDTEIYKQLEKDFDHISWDSHCQLYKEITPRQFLGNSAFTAFSVVPFYYLQFLQEKNSTYIYDIGCGWNIFKKYIPNIIGVANEEPNSRYFYGDVHGTFDQKYIDTHQNFYDCAFSINALHFVSLQILRQRVIDFISIISHRGRGFLTLNAMRMIERSSDNFLVNTFGTNKPTNQQFDWYIRRELRNLPCEMIVIDIDVLDSINDVMEGNIRLVFDKKK
jgi:hypothetical protein